MTRMCHRTYIVAYVHTWSNVWWIFDGGPREGNTDYLHLVITRSHSLSVVPMRNGAQSRAARGLPVSTTADRAAVRRRAVANVVSLSCAPSVHNREIRLLQSGLFCIPLCISVREATRISSNAPVIYVANRAWTNNMSSCSRFLSSCFWVAIIHRPRYISFQTFLAHENTIRAEDLVLPLR